MICKKKRRKIIYNSKVYIWYVSPDIDSIYNILHIISEDKSLILAYPLKTETFYIISKGSVFQRKKTNGCWNRYIVPFRSSEQITPKFVSQLISWATGESNGIKIEWNGKDIPV